MDQYLGQTIGQLTVAEKVGPTVCAAVTSSNLCRSQAMRQDEQRFEEIKASWSRYGQDGLSQEDTRFLIERLTELFAQVEQLEAENQQLLDNQTKP